MNQAIAFQQIAGRLRQLDDWEDRYRFILELGQTLPELTDAEKTPANRVDGCASQVWLVSLAQQCDNQAFLTYRGGSDAKIVQGLIAILLALYSGQAAAEIVRTDAMVLFDEMGLRDHLTTQRTNGLAAMVNRIRADAQALGKQ